MGKYEVALAEDAQQPQEQALQQALERIEASQCGERMKSALREVAEGVPYRDAAANARYGSHKELYQYARKFGIAEFHKEQLQGEYQQIAGLANQELKRRLLERPDDISDRDLVVISGVAADKVVRLQSQPSSGPSPISQLFEALHQAGRLTVEQRVSYERGTHEAEPVTIDVTPASDHEPSQ